nr:MAG: zer-1-like protein [Metapenaeus ensis nimavirus]
MCIYKSRFYCHGLISQLRWLGTTMENSPQPLLRICGTYLVSNNESFCVQERGTDLWRLAPGIKLPRKICEYLILYWSNVCHKFPSNKFLSIFRDTAKTNLRVVILRDTPQTDENLTILLSHNVEELYLINCRTLTKTGLEKIGRHKSLRVLVIVEYMLPNQIDIEDPIEIPLMRSLNKLVIKSMRIRLESPDSSEINNLKHFEYGPLTLPFSLRSFPNIKNLTVLKIPNTNVHPDHILTILELTSLVLVINAFGIRTGQLVELSVFDYPSKKSLFMIAFYLCHFSVLDISTQLHPYRPIKRKNTGFFLKKLVETLKNLMSLDISGTDLLAPTYGNAAFETRMDRQFDFVGVYRTFRTSKCQIPAEEVPPLIFSFIHVTPHDAFHHGHQLIFDSFSFTFIHIAPSMSSIIITN